MAENGLFPVSHKRHSNRYWRSFTSYQFAEEMSACPIVVSEVSKIATSFPIVFQQNEEGFLPAALLSVVSECMSPFVGQNGRWLAPYVPSELRCFPFQSDALSGNGHRWRLTVDESSGLVTRDPQDNPFFTMDGQLAQKLCQVQLFLQSRQISATETNRLCSLIAELDLFVPLNEYDGITLPQRCWGIDARRLDRLPDAYTLMLLASRALKLIHAHQVSLSHCAWLFRAQIDRSVSASGPNDALGGFITAMAEDVLQGQKRSEVIHAMG
ncbi:SapC family protein [Ruegeria sp. ANG-R]|uniref:SapC family protein n=1 Tax=Ruegeria sp. ANG-R TaxID=1577903 RepID=UPI00057FA316|nr:SapC family protein [Ruegeria sp. ANG-R]KIC37121.1 SapC family protein [Ruegeria sp. ANG-R]